MARLVDQDLLLFTDWSIFVGALFGRRSNRVVVVVDVDLLVGGCGVGFGGVARAT